MIILIIITAGKFLSSRMEIQSVILEPDDLCHQRGSLSPIEYMHK